MNDLYIKYFLEIVEQGVSFTKASRVLFVSQSSLTKHINSLNEELGVKLIDTTRRNAARLTPAGRRYYEFFSEYREKFQKVRDDVKALAGQKTGEIRIAAFAEWDMLPPLPLKVSFGKKYPYIEVSITSASFRGLKTGLLNNQHDLVVTLSDQFRGIPNISIHDHYRIPGILLFSSKHPLSQKKNPDITEFRDDIFYVLTEDETPMVRQICEDYCKSKGFLPHFKVLPNLNSILLALQNGYGYTIVDEWTRLRKDPNFINVELDMCFTISDVWKEDNENKALPLFLNTCILAPANTVLG
jgi:DNA-binding transcriptional LysR family regulator